MAGRSGEESDAVLLARTRLGDRAARERLVRRYLGAAYSLALSVLRNEADAEDASQDAMVFALERLAQCRDPERFGAWLLRIVRNRALDLMDRRAVRAAEPLDRVDAPCTGAGPATDAERADLRARLLGALDQLKPLQREVVLMHDMEGWTHAEIGAALGCSEGMSRQHLFHARGALRALLGHRLLGEWYGQPAG